MLASTELKVCSYNMSKPAGAALCLYAFEVWVQTTSHQLERKTGFGRPNVM
jgi:hypothetical protein